MAKNFIQPGDRLTLLNPDTSPSRDIASGEGALFGSIFGIAITDIPAGEEGAVETTGVWELPKTSAQAWTVGAKIYWNNTLHVVTTSSSGNTLIGVAVEIAANPSAVGKVRLNGAF